VKGWPRIFRWERASPSGARYSRGRRRSQRGVVEANAQALARYAVLCQEAGSVPAVEPEVLIDGAHTLQRYSQIAEEVLRTVFSQLYTQAGCWTA
jgi:fructose-bisphosphate aldolase class 1